MPEDQVLWHSPSPPQPRCVTAVCRQRPLSSKDDCRYQAIQKSAAQRMLVLLQGGSARTLQVWLWEPT